MTRDHDTDDLVRWPALARKIAPLPGGLAALRNKLQSPARRPRVWAFAFAAICAAGLALYVATDPVVRIEDRTAMRRLLTNQAGLPHPGATALGLVEQQGQLAEDPRLRSNDAFVFRWVAPVAPAPAIADPHD